MLSSGRCLPTCSKNQFFDASSSSCQSCDNSCASCSGSGSSNCLSCSDGNSVLRGGSCVTASCSADTNVVAGLGACFSDLVAIPDSASKNTTITGLDSPAVDDKGTKLEWWQILLMALGCAFVVLCLLLCWRRRAKKKRAQATQEFARAKNLDNPMSFRDRLVRFGERLFGHSLGERVLGSRGRRGAGPIALGDHDKDALEMRDIEDAKYHDTDMNRLLDSYARPSTHKNSHSRAPSMTTYDPRSSYFPPGYRPSKHGDDQQSRKPSWRTRSTRKEAAHRDGPKRDRDLDLNTMSDESLYSYVTGQQRRTADARQPQRAPPVPTSSNFTALEARDLDKRAPLHSRFSDYTASTLSSRPRGHEHTHSRGSSRGPTPAEEYASSVRSREYHENARQRSRSRSPLGRAVDYGLVDLGENNNSRADYWLKPNYTGGSSGSGSKNPFRR